VPTLRPAVLTDAPAIAALHIASWQAVYRAELSEAFLDNQSLEARTEHWRQHLSNTETRMMLLDAADRLLGFAASGPTRDRDAPSAEVWELYALHIAPDCRRGGLGSRLFIATVDLARRARRSTLTLWVVASNMSARRFYEKHGMAADGGTQVHQIGPDDRLNEVRYRSAL
jgi:GNAT superfamily N-acetyltransferase